MNEQKTRSGDGLGGGGKGKREGGRKRMKGRELKTQGRQDLRGENSKNINKAESERGLGL